jgi:hypothetical protein
MSYMPVNHEAFGRLPNEWARDPETSAECLCILAYRTTFADDNGCFGLWQDALSARPILASGFGRDVRERAIADAVRSGRLTRPRNVKLPRGPGQRFARAVDHLHLPPDLHMDNSRMVWRSWFDGTLSCNEMAALLYMHAGTVKGPGVYARELAARFDWSRPKAMAVLHALLGRGLIGVQRRTDVKGRVEGVTYAAALDMPAEASLPEPTVKNPGHGDGPLSKNQGTASQGTEIQGTYEGTPFDVQKKQESTFSPATPTRSMHDSASRIEPAAPARRDNPWFADHLLGWLDNENSRIAAIYFGTMSPITDAMEDELVDAFPDDRALLELAMDACEDRLGTRLRTEGGMDTIRHLAAGVMAHARGNLPADDLAHHRHSTVTPQGAMRMVIQAMHDRIGNHPGAWMNSYAVIGQRLAGEMYSGGCIVEDVGSYQAPAPTPRAVEPQNQPQPQGPAPRPSRRRQQEDPIPPALCIADGWGILHKNLVRYGGQELREFAAAEAARYQCDATDIIDTLAVILRNVASGIYGPQRWEVVHGIVLPTSGPQRSYVARWRYFSRLVARERGCKQQQEKTA